MMPTAKQRKQQQRFKQAVPKAKKLYKTGKYKTYGAAMKAALNGCSTPATMTGRKKVKRWQTGKSDKSRDEQREALKPGKRKSRSGVTYFERRKNRTDMPGKLTGTGTMNELYIRNLNERNRSMIEADTRLVQLKKVLQITPRGADRNKVKGYIKEQKKYISVLKKEIRMLKALLK